jgi:pyruvate dehydrogenase E1 component beta subunit
MSGGQVHVPVVIRIGCGMTAIGGTTFAQLGTFYAHVPGLILSAGTHED